MPRQNIRKMFIKITTSIDYKSTSYYKLIIKKKKYKKI